MVSKGQKTKKLTMTDREIAGDLLDKAEKGFYGLLLKRRLRRLIHTLGIHEYKTIRDRNGRRVKKCQYCSNIKLFERFEEQATSVIMGVLCSYHTMGLLANFHPFLNWVHGLTALLILYGFIKIMWQCWRSSSLD